MGYLAEPLAGLGSLSRDPIGLIPDQHLTVDLQCERRDHVNRLNDG
jgi:hypothetical protein